METTVPLWLFRPAGCRPPPPIASVGPHQRGYGADVRLQLLGDQQQLPQLCLQAGQLLRLLPEQLLLFAHAQLFRLPAQLKLQAVAVHETVGPVQLSLDRLAVGDDRLDALVAGEHATRGDVMVEVRDSALDTSKLFVQHLKR